MMANRVPNVPSYFGFDDAVGGRKHDQVALKIEYFDGAVSLSNAD